MNQTINSEDFIHLQVHSDFSIINGLTKINKFINNCVEQQMPAMALTDVMNLCGIVKFYSESLTKGVKPIIGVDVLIEDNNQNDHNRLTNQSKNQDNNFQLTLLAKNDQGYKNIIQLLSKSYRNGYINLPNIKREWLAKYSSGIIILSGDCDGDIGKALLNNNFKLATNYLNFYQEHFKDHFYLSLVRIGRSNEELYISNAVQLAKQFKIPVVATNRVCFLNQIDFMPHEIRVAIHDGYVLDDSNRPKLYTEQQYFKTGKQMVELFADIPQAIINTKLIATRCNLTITLGKSFLPHFPTGDISAAEFLVKQANKGLNERLMNLFPDPSERESKKEEYQDRLNIELDVINQMDFPGYFLIVMEFIQWSKNNNIPVGPGRGSGAGSLVAYALNITDLDPIQFDLLFERFLNPERVSMPDFDIDFCIEGREKVIEHIADIYGQDAVSQIITFGTMAAKGAIRDVGRVLGHPYGFVDRIAKLIPKDLGITIDKALENEPDLKKLYQENEEIRLLIDYSRNVEGVIRTVGKHAAGVVISPTKISDFAPIYCDQDGKNPVTHFDKNDVEYIGLVKFDFLGLRNLTTIKWAIEMINAKRPVEQHIDISKIPLDDKKSYDKLIAGETTAIFQLESRGMKELIKKLKPDCFEDIIALVALFRPGPLQSGMVDNFINRKHGLEEISYPDKDYQHLSLKTILEPTYGIILYQEQVMQIAQVLAGYSLGGADLLRRAMGKKKPEEMEKQRSIFKEGAIKNNIDGDLSMKIFNLVEKFAGYGFNKSHSAAYALIAYQTLWLKTHFPAEFMASVMNSELSDTDKIVGLYDECERMGIKIIFPDINLSQYLFTVNENQEIVYGLGAIKGVGEAAIKTIIEAREQGNFFKDIYDLCGRIDIKKINRGTFNSLIASGALDKLGPHRAALDANLEDAIKQSDQQIKDLVSGQIDMFGMMNNNNASVEKAYAKIPEWTEQLRLDKEKQALGLYISGHPVTRYLKELEQYRCTRLRDIKENRSRETTLIGGLISDTRKIVTKNGARIGLATIDDRSANIEIKLFNDQLEKYGHLLIEDSIIIVRGNIRMDDFRNSLSMNVSEIYSLLDMREQNLSNLAISISEQQITPFFIKQLKILLNHYTDNGTIPINIYYQNKYGLASLKTDNTWRVRPEDKLINELKNLLGQEQVELEFS